MIDLKQHLATIPAGPISNRAALEKLLGESWDQFTGDNGGMAGYKLRRAHGRRGVESAQADVPASSGTAGRFFHEPQSIRRIGKPSS